MRAADGHFQNDCFVRCIAISHLDAKISRGREQLLVVEVNLITANAMVVLWLVIILGVSAKRAKNAIKVMQILESKVFLNNPHPGFRAGFA